MPNIKTAISIPATLFEKAEKKAREMSISRSEFYSLAVEDYLKRQENRQLLKEIDMACDGPDQRDDAYQVSAKRRHRRIVEGEW